MNDPRKGRRNAEIIHRRWQAKVNQREWAADQCGVCLYWIPLAGQWGLDWGACCNADSPFDGRVMFEHDGCPVFRKAEKWARPEDFQVENSGDA